VSCPTTLSSLSPQAETASDAEVYQRAYATALRLLVRREHSAQELRHKLNERRCPLAVAEEVVAALREEGALSDRRFAEVYVQGRFERGFGPLRITAELRERGVEQRLIDATLEEYAPAWQASARRQRDKRFGPRLPAAFSDRVPQMRFLQQRGFSAEQIHAALGAGIEADD
jgi:regulatory protein